MKTRLTTSSQSGCLSKLISFILIGTILMLMIEFSKNESGTKSYFWVIVIFFIFFMILSLSIITTEIKAKFKSAEYVLQNDSRAPVLYLRSFNSDIADKFNGIAITTTPNFEQQLAFTINQIGPFIALSSPSSDEISLGASKLSRIETDWQNVVIEYLDKCSLVIIRVGESEGLIWEIRQIALMGYLDKIVIYFQFPGLQDTDLIESRFRKFNKMLANITNIAIYQNLGKNRFMILKNQQAHFAKTLPLILNKMEFNVEENFYRSIAKGMWLGADNSFRKPISHFKSNKKKFRLLLFFLCSSFTTIVIYIIISTIILSFESFPGSIMLAMSFIGNLFGGVLVGRISVLFNIAGGTLHVIFGCFLMLLSIYVYYSALCGSWDFFTAFNLIVDEDIIPAFLMTLVTFIWIPLFCYIYGWSKAEQRLSEFN